MAFGGALSTRCRTSECVSVIVITDLTLAQGAGKHYLWKLEVVKTESKLNNVRKVKIREGCFRIFCMGSKKQVVMGTKKGEQTGAVGEGAFEF